VEVPSLQPHQFSACKSSREAFGVMERDQHVAGGADNERLVPHTSEFRRTIEIEQHPHSGGRDRERRKGFAGHIDGAVKFGFM